MAKVKKVEKRSTPKKAAKRKPHSSDSYLKLADAIMHPTKPEPSTAVRANRTHKAAVKSKLVKMTKPELAEESKREKAPVIRGVRFEARYPERIPEKPPEPEAPKVEITVRSIYYDGQYLPALCFRKPGAMHVPCVAGDPVNGVRKFTVAAAQHDKSPIVQHGYGNFAAPYSPEKFAAHMRRIAGAAPITPEARMMLLPYCPDMPHGPAALPVAIGAGAATPDDEAPRVRVRTQPGNGSRAPAGPARTSGKELIRTLAAVAKLPPEKVRAKLRAAGMRAPYTDENACRKALGVKA